MCSHFDSERRGWWKLRRREGGDPHGDGLSRPEPQAGDVNEGESVEETRKNRALEQSENVRDDGQTASGGTVSPSHGSHASRLDDSPDPSHDYAGLVERLRMRIEIIQGQDIYDWHVADFAHVVEDDLKRAVDRIEELEALLREYGDDPDYGRSRFKEIDLLKDQRAHDRLKIQGLEAKLDRYRQALERIAKGRHVHGCVPTSRHGWDCSPDCPVRIAKEALDASS